MKLSRIIFCAQLYLAIVYGGVTMEREASDIVNLEKDRDDAEKLPSFKWDDAKKDGVERLIIMFSDGSQDTALLQLSFPDIEGADCMFEGTLKDEMDARIVVNGCPGDTTFDLTLFSKKTEYEIFEVIDGRVSQPPKLSVDDISERSVMAPNRDASKIRDFSTEMDSTQLRSSLPSSMELRVALLFDDNWWAIFGQNYKQPMLKVMNLGKIWFQHYSLDVKLDVKLVDADRYIPGDFKTGHDRTSSYTLPMAKRMLDGSYGKYENGEPDIYVIFTEDATANSGGVAYDIGKVCSKIRGERVVIVEGLLDNGRRDAAGLRYPWTGLMFAHEIGHSLGMMHDFEGLSLRGRTCPPSGLKEAPLVMSYGWSMKNSEDIWSTCSNYDFKNYITGKGQTQGGRFCTQVSGAACKNTPPGDCNQWGCDSWTSYCDQQFSSFFSWCNAYNAQGKVKDFCQTSCQTACG